MPPKRRTGRQDSEPKQSGQTNPVAVFLKQVAEVTQKSGVDGYRQFLKLAEHMEGTSVSLEWFEQQLAAGDLASFQECLRDEIKTDIYVRNQHFDCMRNYLSQRQRDESDDAHSDSDSSDSESSDSGDMGAHQFGLPVLANATGVWEEGDVWEEVVKQKSTTKRKTLNRYEKMMFEFKTVQCPRDVRNDACRDLACDKWHAGASPADRRRAVRKGQANNPPWAYEITDYRNRYEYLYHPQHYKVCK
jgi:hypothetical protein